MRQTGDGQLSVIAMSIEFLALTSLSSNQLIDELVDLETFKITWNKNNLKLETK